MAQLIDSGSRQVARTGCRDLNEATAGDPEDLGLGECGVTQEESRSSENARVGGGRHTVET